MLPLFVLLKAICCAGSFVLVSSTELSVAPLHITLVHVCLICGPLLIEQLLICKGAAIFNRVKIRLLMHSVLSRDACWLIRRRSLHQ